MTTVSVIIPAHPARVHNGMLGEAVASVWAQTRQPDAVHVAMDNERAGAAATRDRALRSARTDFVAFLDSDDILLPKHLQWLMAHQQETGADFCYAWFKVLQCMADGTKRVLEEDPIFPVGHYLNDFNPADPIETTITTLVRTELAQQVGFTPLDRGEQNSGEDFGFLLGCLKAGAKVSHLRRKSWLWRHAWLTPDVMANTSGLPTKGDAAADP